MKELEKSGVSSGGSGSSGAASSSVRSGGSGSGGVGSGSGGAGSSSVGSSASCGVIRKRDGSDHGSDGGGSGDGALVEGQEKEGKLPAVVRSDRSYVVTFSKKPQHDMTVDQGDSGASVKDPEMEEININARLQIQYKIPAQVCAGC